MRFHLRTSSLLSLGAVLLACLGATGPAQAAAPVVQTNRGALQGATQDGINVFRGIPYAAVKTQKWMSRRNTGRP